MRMRGTESFTPAAAMASARETSIPVFGADPGIPPKLAHAPTATTCLALAASPAIIAETVQFVFVLSTPVVVSAE